MGSRSIIPRPLTAKQKEFVTQYLVDLCAGKAALRAGYSRRNPDQIGYQLLQKTSVADAIKQAIDARSQRVRLNADDMVRALIADVSADILEIFAHDGSIRPVAEWPEKWRSGGLVEYLEVTEHLVRRGKNRGKTVRITRIRFADRTRLKWLLGRAVGAF